MTYPIPALATFVRLALITAWIVIAVAVFSAGLHFERQGGRLLSVQTGSMRPTVQPGDMLVVYPVQANQLRLGDIVTYYKSNKNSPLISHRLYAKPSPGVFITKGDANAKPDSPLVANQIAGRVVAVAPHLGKALKVASSKLGMVGLVYVPALIITLDQVRRVVLAHNAVQYSSRTRG